MKSATITDLGKFKPIYGMQAAQKTCELHPSGNKIKSKNTSAHQILIWTHAKLQLCKLTGMSYKRISFNHYTCSLK